MGEAAMNLTPEQMASIGEYVRGHIHEWIGTGSDSAITERALDQRERIIRVEESLKQGFEQSEKHFEQMDKRFTDLIHHMDKRFTDLIHHMDKRFEQSDKRIDDFIHQSDKRFEQVDKRFSQMFAYFTTGIVVLGLMMSVYKFLI